MRLIAAAASASARAGRLGGDDGLDAVQTAAVRAIAARAPAGAAALARTSPARAATATAALLGYEAIVDENLRDLDHGTWAGRSLDEIARTDAAAVERWTCDLTSAPHGGESVATLVARAGAWLEARDERGELTCVTHPAFMRGIVLTVLDARLEAFHSVDVQPLHAIDLTRAGRRWRLRAANLPL